MKKIIKALFLLLCILVGSMTNVINLHAQGEWPQGPEVFSESGIIMEMESGAVVYDHNAREALFPASITKILTALVAIENSKLDEVVTFSHNAVFNLEPGSSHIARDEDEQMTMEQCLYALLLESANECATAIAEHIAGSVEGFAAMMNAKTVELGCINSHFVNANGLHDDDHYTCAYDMALIARAAFKNPTFALITGTKTYVIPPTNKHEEPTLLNNHHQMLHYYQTQKYIYEGCLGGKTGYTSKAGNTLVTYASRNGITLICVSMRGERGSCYIDTTNLFNYYFSTLQKVSVGEIMERSEGVTKTGISILSEGESPFSMDTGAGLCLPIDYDVSLVKQSFALNTQSNDAAIGHIMFEYEGKPVGMANLNTAYIESYPFRNHTPGETIGEDYIKINIIKVLMTFVIVLAVLIVLIVAFVKTGSAITLLRRKKIEHRDPHKNLRQIRRRRNARRRRR